MGFLSRAVAESKGATSVWERWIQLSQVVGLSKAGQSVTLDTAVRQSAAFGCMRVISQGGAQLPFKLFRETEEAGLRRIRPAREHGAYDLVTAKPNAWQTSFEFIEQLLLHASLGNAYVFKSSYRGQVAEMFLLNPAHVKAEQKDDWSITYKVRGKNGEEREVDPGFIWHVRGPSWDGFLGVETLQVAREALGLSMALDESVAKLHANGVRPSGVYSVEGPLNITQQKQLVQWLKENASANNAGNPLVLDRGAKWLSQAMSSVDAQHREMRQHQIEEVCRFFGVLPIMIGYTGDKASTYASAEAMFAAHKIHTLAPWLRRVELSADVNLLTDAERKKGYYFKFVINGLLHAAAKDQAEYLAKALGSGGSPAWMTQDEARALLELDPMGGDAAKLPPLINRQSTGNPATS